MAITQWELSRHQQQVGFQYKKLLIGLSTGAVIAIAAFLRDLFAVPVAKPLLLITIFSFAVSVLFSMFYISALTEYAISERLSPVTRWMGTPWVSIIAEVSFYVGFVCLAIFVIYNLWFMPPPLTTEPSPPNSPVLGKLFIFNQLPTPPALP